MKDPAVEKTELVIKALDYAHEHNLNINNDDDVKKILGALEMKENVDEFRNLLQSADAFMELKAAEKEPKKLDLPN